MRRKYGERDACRYCGQDIENRGRRQWTDRGGNRDCCPFIDNKLCVVITPRTKHAPPRRNK